MLKAIKLFFDQNLLPKDTSTAGTSEHSLHLATAAMLLEMANTDETIRPEEMERIDRYVRNELLLTDSEAENLIRLAKEELKDATDFHQFTRLINDAYNEKQKVRIIEELWKVALSDDHLDPYEEHFVRKIADLLHLPHRLFITAKLKVSGSS